MHILNNGCQKIVISILLVRLVGSNLLTAFRSFFNRKVFSFNLTSFFYIRSIKLITFFIFIFEQLFCNNEFIIVIFNNNGIAVRWICQILIMLSTVSYWLSKHGGGHTRTSSGDPSSGPFLYTVALYHN